MRAALSAIVSEFETAEQAASYDRWFRAKVQASRDDPRPSIPHDEAMARIREKLAAKLNGQQTAAIRPDDDR
ncbi:hypothetical protein CAL14_10060 [Bordetella genomosp. 9]|uniref:type II toxin-antitoxin system RelB family antitoxin n=1 Tax=Bordetella genomosp. 9 TaxID=1416803 RepID=UPI000A293514|nr:antitoxin [Bordetella genomosp. 9]ARP90598.1 hypothetical protein CAL14_10060 [Bordetella genomosp. 9]